MASEDILFKTALDAIEKGERRRARDLLTRLLKTDQKNPQYWVWMSTVVETSKESIFCLKEALKLDPENQLARRGLILYGVLPLDEKIIIPIEQQRSSWKASVTPPSSRKDKFMQSSLRTQVVYAAGALVVVAALIALVVMGIGKVGSLLAVRETPVALDLPRFIAPTSTPPTQQPTPTFPGPTPLWVLLESTYTPTPMYISTPHSSTESYRSAMRAYNRQDYAAMLNFIQQVLEFEPQAPDLHFYAGEAHRLMGDLLNAEAAYLLALEFDPAFAPAYLGLARVHLASDPEQVDQARSELREAIKLDPGYADAYLEMAHFSLQQGSALIAREYLDEVEKITPQSPLLALYRGQAALLQADYDAALLYALEAHQLDFTLLPAYRLLGEIHTRLGAPDKALGYLMTYVLYEPDDAQAQIWLSQAHSALEEYDLALDAANDALRIDPQNVDGLIQRGEIYIGQKKGLLASSDLLEAVHLAPDSFIANLGLGRAYLQQDLNRMAYNRLSSALSLASDDTEEAFVYYYRAQALENLSETRQAIRDWQALIQLEDADIQSDWIQTANQHLSTLATPTRTPQPSRTATRTPGSLVSSPSITVSPSPTRTRTPTRTPTPTGTPTPSSSQTQDSDT